MFRRNTVFIVGAGASKELGLPTGAELSAQIVTMCDVTYNRFGEGTDPRSYRTIQEMRRQSNDDVTKINGWLAAMGDIQRALPFKDSIDAVIDQYHDRPEVAEIGKFMIAKLILDAERGSYLGLPFGDEAAANLVTSTWLHTFCRMLFEGIRADELGSVGNNVDVICFNYDRCIEKYLVYALTRAYGLLEDEAIRVVSRVNILHVYGSLGALPDWPDGKTSKHKSAFGSTTEDAWKVASNLRTFSESVDSDTDEKIKAIIRRGEQYVYLGLSFGRQNMDLLTTDTGERGVGMERSAFASGKGQFEQSKEIICDLIRGTYSKNHTVAVGSSGSRTRLELDRTAKDVLDLHWHNILG